MTIYIYIYVSVCKYVLSYIGIIYILLYICNIYICIIYKCYIYIYINIYII